MYFIKSFFFNLYSKKRMELIYWYCDMQLREYKTIFKNNPEAAGLDALSRRFAWLKRLLKVFDEEHNLIFPSYWRVAEHLCEKFCIDTR
jgi:hypothetical protein